MSPTNLILSGGISHAFDETSAIVAGHLEGVGIRSDILPIRDGLARLTERHFDLLTVNALAFTMTQAEKHAPYRAHAFSIRPADRKAIEGHMASGGRLLGLHTAAICFDDWPDWKELLGVNWQWGISYHPATGPIRVQADPGFETVDELYCDLSLSSGSEVLATATAPGIRNPQPVLTRRGNAAYLALGHDRAACENSGYIRLLTQAIETLNSPLERSA